MRRYISLLWRILVLSGSTNGWGMPTAVQFFWTPFAPAQTWFVERNSIGMANYLIYRQQMTSTLQYAVEFCLVQTLLQSSKLTSSDQSVSHVSPRRLSKSLEMAKYKRSQVLFVHGMHALNMCCAVMLHADSRSLLPISFTLAPLFVLIMTICSVQTPQY